MAMVVLVAAMSDSIRVRGILLAGILIGLFSSVAILSWREGKRETDNWWQARQSHMRCVSVGTTSSFCADESGAVWLPRTDGVCHVEDKP